MLQNSNELRPTGGFTGSYIELEIANGQLTTFKIDDIYNPDGLLTETNPNQSLIQKADNHALPLRDANWYADIPASAAITIDKYKQATGRQVDGVVYLTLHAVKPILQQLGPIYLEEYQETVTAQNFDTLAQTHSNTNYISGSTNKKDFLGVLSQQVINQLNQPAKIPSLAQAISTGLQTKEIQLYSTNPDIQLLIAQYNWGGLTQQASTDYLRVVDANVIGNKSNHYIYRSTNYHVNVDRQGQLSAVTTINWDHTGQSATWPGGDYQNYLRVYAPLGATLTDSQGFADKVISYTESGKQVFAGLVSVPYNHQTQAVLRYNLPLHLSLANTDYAYQLAWQKQSGILSEPLNIQFNAPTFLQFQSASSGAINQPGRLSWSKAGDTDQHFSSSFSPVP
jgi:hypothetical protein